MNARFKIITVGIGIAVVAATVFGINKLAVQKDQAKPHSTVLSEAGVMRYAAGSPQLSSLKVMSLSDMPMPVAEPVSARISYDENVTARISSPIAGRVLAAHAEIGDAVSRNMDLLDVDSPDFAAAEADWEKAKADQDRKKLAFDRAKLLLQHEVIPRKDFESADADYRQAAAEAKRAGLRLHNLDASMRERGNDGRFALRSPISGVVTEKQVNPGLEIRPDLPNPLFVISDITRLWVLIDLPERSISHVHRGQRITLETDTYPGERFTGEVDRIGLALDPATRRIPVRCSIVNPDKKLKPEMFARVAFIADGNRRGIHVPNTSLVLDGLHSFVFVETEPGVFRKRRVNIAIRGTDDSFIDGGLTAGDRVVTEGALLLNSEIVNDAQ